MSLSENIIRETDKNIKYNIDDPQFDSEQIDSGFLSGANIVTNVDEDSRKYKKIETDNNSNLKYEEYNYNGKINEEQMRADSGIVDGAFCESLSHLNLEPVTLNSLNGKVQSEPNGELSPIIDSQLKSSELSQKRVNIVNPQDIYNAEKLYWLHYSQDEDGDTQLHIAIVQGFHEVALSLIRMAPHPSLFDCLNQKRQSPLHLAVLTHQPSIARQLILAGANPGLRNSNGNTALHLASTSGDLACAKALTNPLLLAERKLLIPGRQAPGIPQDLEQPNYEGETCLHSAVIAGNMEIVRLLIGIGADIEAKERLGGRTALHLAIECRRRAITSLLLNEYHPHLNAITYGGLTAYEIASCWDKELAKELVGLGATPVINDYIESNEDISKIPQLWNIGLRV